MSEADDNAPVRTAGSILREARQAQGVHIAALAATIKVAQRKLESLEGDRLDELPDTTFTRALAQTVCRALKIDPAPVLALLPQPTGLRLEHVAEGLREPFRERAGRETGDWTSALASPAVWGVLSIVVLTAVVWLMPQHWLAVLQPGSGASAPAASAPSTVSSPASSPVSSPVVPALALPPSEAASSAEATQPALAAPASPSATASGVSPTPESAGVLRLRTIAASWIEVQDGRSQVLLSRVVEAGEAIDLDGPTPLRVKIGNARATEVLFRGRALDLAPSTRDNVARLELQ